MFSDCSSDYEPHGKRYCYKYIPKKKTWIEALKYCRINEGAHLPGINDQEEDCYVGGIAKDTDKFWLGGRLLTEYKQNDTSREDLRKKFIWTDGTRMDYKNWNDISRPRCKSCSQDSVLLS